MANNFKKFLQFTAGAVGIVSGALYVQSKYGKELSAVLPLHDVLYDGFRKHPSYPQKIMKFGFPRSTTIISMENFVLQYNFKNKTADWVYEHITEDSVSPNSGITRKGKRFTPDDTVPANFQSIKADYKKSVYTKGHLAAAGNHRLTPNSHEETFILSNIVPMHEEFNNGIWLKLENRIRKLAAEHKEIFVCSGPMYLPKEPSDKVMEYELFGENNIAVPTHYYKIAVWEAENGKYDMIGYNIPHEKKKVENLSRFKVDREKIYKDSGFLHFHEIKDADIRNINNKPIDDQPFVDKPMNDQSIVNKPMNDQPKEKNDDSSGMLASSPRRRAGI